MLKRKQVAVIVLVTLVSFLIGVTLNHATAYVLNGGGSGNPWNKVWEAIYELQSRVQTLEAKVEVLENQSRSWRMIRFHDNETYYVEKGQEPISVNITWTPTCTSFNLLTRAIHFVEGRGARLGQQDCWNWQLIIHWGGIYKTACPSKEITDIDADDQWQWSLAYDGMSDYQSGFIGLFNRVNYTFEFKLWASNGNCYIRNINLIIEVVDGLPPS